MIYITLSRFCFVGPTTHNFYIWLDQFVPRDSRYAALKRIILDRFIFAPPWLMVYFYILALLEVRNRKIFSFHTGNLILYKQFLENLEKVFSCCLKLLLDIEKVSVWAL